MTHEGRLYDLPSNVSVKTLQPFPTYPPEFVGDLDTSVKVLFAFLFFSAITHNQIGGVFFRFSIFILNTTKKKHRALKLAPSHISSWHYNLYEKIQWKISCHTSESMKITLTHLHTKTPQITRVYKRKQQLTIILKHMKTKKNNSI